MLVAIIQNVMWALSKLLSRHHVGGEHGDLTQWQKNPLLINYVCWKRKSTFYWDTHMELFPRNDKLKKKIHRTIYFPRTHFCKALRPNDRVCICICIYMGKPWERLMCSNCAVNSLAGKQAETRGTFSGRLYIYVSFEHFTTRMYQCIAYIIYTKCFN